MGDPGSFFTFENACSKEEEQNWDNKYTDH